MTGKHHRKEPRRGVKFNALNGTCLAHWTISDVLVDPVQIQVQGIDPLTGQLIYGNAQVGKQTNKGVEADVGYVIDVGTNELALFGTFYRANPLNATGSTPSSAVKVKNTLSGNTRWAPVLLRVSILAAPCPVMADRLARGSPGCRPIRFTMRFLAMAPRPLTGT